ncbi:thiosulfate sulfurtransferase GlpE [Paraferrimonas haliotis]|uniref:Thiosulfate sulfurtransferase GlpE n=1 Tax=Paraferrimonas haliotis TaxID=2013866 RepID=A0AA37TLS4_9GAMM|nr:thiosulfate sulfurtransferase GlpE [Paraferrimonas haliotis]GLS83534.1 thiosulfate sulfurtransferase GlpE [Paraferrimonas haliotis]
MTSFQRISVIQASELLEKQAAKVLDIRDPQSFSQGHIPGSLPLNNDNVQQILDETEEDETVIVVCYHGISSQQAAQYLVEQGLNQVYSLDGGYQAWGQAFG